MVSGAPAPDPDLDLVAAGLRADGLELRISVEVLAAKLEQALPGATRVQRRGGGLLGRGDKQVSRVLVALGDWRYELAVDGGRLQGSRVREVGGIAIKRESLDAQAWVTALTDGLRAEAQRSAQAREALSQLLD